MILKPKSKIVPVSCRWRYFAVRSLDSGILVVDLLNKDTSFLSIKNGLLPLNSQLKKKSVIIITIYLYFPCIY